MRRSLRQAASLALVLLFGTSLAASAYGWHGCPHHGHGSASAGSPAPSSAGPAVDVLRHDEDRRPGTEPGTCTCLGSCHVGASPVLASHPGIEIADDDLVRVPAGRAPARRPNHIRPAYFLPFPHGPPALG